jgi:hypothetical protein
MITYRATLDVPRELAQHLGRLLHAERRRRGTRKTTRALTCFRQAVLGLRWFRQSIDITALARDHGISRATGHRYPTRSSRSSPIRHRICTTPCNESKTRAWPT